ncbi:MAG TPA: hypothetical protein VGN74_09840 [Brevundimonas sp.]|jgi:hypothetical protein|uniref:hypothetical protein n=1 Tax=Brevundimonas sp. TaxID=1871086 RepID=UPI002E13E2C9|nr:hypothetical protein [Brevundimonas sp.]
MTRIAIVTAAALLALGAAACTPAEEERAEAEAAETGQELETGAERFGAAVGEEAAQVGAAIEAGAREAGQEIDQATDAMAEEATETRAELDARAEAERGN